MTVVIVFASTCSSASGLSGAGSTHTPPRRRRQQRIEQLRVDAVDLRDEIAQVVRRIRG